MSLWKKIEVNVLEDYLDSSHPVITLTNEEKSSSVKVEISILDVPILSSMIPVVNLDFIRTMAETINKMCFTPELHKALILYFENRDLPRLKNIDDDDDDGSDGGDPID